MGSFIGLSVNKITTTSIVHLYLKYDRDIEFRL